MNIVAYVHLYVPQNNAGAEVMLHQILLELMLRGHKAKVICYRPKLKEYQNIVLINSEDKNQVEEALNNSDIIITQLIGSLEISLYLTKYHKPVVNIIHNDSQIKRCKVHEGNTNLIVANSEWIYNTVKLNVKKIIVNPPTKLEDYLIESNNKRAITFINLIKDKGADIFWSLVKALPNEHFIGVKGGYGNQIIPKDIPSNVTIYENTPDINHIYKQTKILLVPSLYESWGRVGIESFCSGIPVIAYPTPGLKESLGDAGIFVTKNSVDEYVEKINFLNDETNYSTYSNQAVLRAKELELRFKEQIEVLETEMINLIPIKRKIDFYATSVQYFDHIYPIWFKIPNEYKGKFYISERIENKAAQLGICYTIGDPKDNPTLISSHEDYYKCTGPIIFLEHGIGFTFGEKEQGFAGSKYKDNVAMFLDPHKFVREKNKETYPKTEGHIIGTPKMDQYPTKMTGQERIVCLSFHFDSQNPNIVPERRSALEYYEPVLETLANSKEFKLVLHGHPSANDQWDELAQKYNIERITQFEDVLDVASVYISDWSSTAYEFAATGRPVIFLNAPYYRKDVNFGLRFWDNICGIQVDDRDLLYQTIINILNDPQECLDIADAALEDIYPYRGQSSQVAANTIVEYLNKDKQIQSSALSIAIMAHPSRIDFVNDIKNKIGGDIAVAWDEGRGLWDTAKRAWLSYDPDATHHLVLQDDIIPSLNLRETLKKAILEYPDFPISIFLGKNRLTPEAERLYKNHYKYKVPWFVHGSSLAGCGIIVPVKLIKDMIDQTDTMSHPADDMRIEAYFKNKQIPILNTVPSLINHRNGEEVPSLSSKQINSHDRGAILFIGEDQSGFDLKWEQKDLPPLIRR